MKTEDIFSPFGILKKRLPLYSYREDQEAMASLVEEAFESNVSCVVEAGTGIGKSFAYLCPAFLLVENDPDATVVVATSTITLEKQLYDKDIPFLKSALGLDPEVSILFGRSNYVCLRRYMAEKLQRELLSLDETTPEAKLDRWIETTGTGSRVDVTDYRVSQIMNEIMSDENDCSGHLCPYFDKCFFYGARRKAQKARIVVTNHHIVLADAQIRWENNEDFSEPTILPGYTHLVMDEAHHLEAEATDVFSDKYSFETVSYVLDELLRKQSRFGNQGILEFLRQYETPEHKGFFPKAKSLIAQVRSEAESYDDMVKAILNTFSDPRSILFTKDFYAHYQARLRDGEQVATDLKTLGQAIEAAYASDNEEAQINIAIALRFANELNYLSDILRTWIRFTAFDTAIPYATMLRDGRYQIRIAPMETGPIIKSRLNSKLNSILFCSATLNVGGKFNYFKERAGLDDPNAVVLEGLYPSPFDFGKQLMYLIPMDGMPFKNNSQDYVDYVTGNVIDSIRASAGGALILFTSIRMMNEVYENVRNVLGKEYELLVQDNRIGRNSLLKRFKDNEDSCLFATSSFWEGIDAPGNTLRLVIIVKLPFDVPTDPINRARTQYIDEHSDKGSFMTLTVPNAVIKMKQGVGRLIRNEEDKGIVMILDSRLITKSYRMTMFNSLPAGYIPEDTMCMNLASKIERFLY